MTIPDRNHTQCSQRWSETLKPGLKKGAWSVEEDARLLACRREHIPWCGGMFCADAHMYNNTSSLICCALCFARPEVAVAVSGRTAKQCRERWKNFLDPGINRSPWTAAEDAALCRAHEKVGNKWSMIAIQVTLTTMLP